MNNSLYLVLSTPPFLSFSLKKEKKIEKGFLQFFSDYLYKIDDLELRTVFPPIVLWHSIIIAQLKINIEGKLQKNYVKAVPEDLL